MKKAFGLLIAAVLFASSAAAAPPPALQGNVVCNSKEAMLDFEKEWAKHDFERTRDNVTRIARKVGSFRKWCIAGFVKSRRASTPAFSDEVLFEQQMISSLAGAIPYIGAFIAARFDDVTDSMERTLAYRTERGRTMYLLRLKSTEEIQAEARIRDELKATVEKILESRQFDLPLPSKSLRPEK